MKISWTQNVTILEVELTIEERAWYLQAAERCSWSKKQLENQISASAHLENPHDDAQRMCYTNQDVFAYYGTILSSLMAGFIMKDLVEKRAWRVNFLSGQWTSAERKLTIRSIHWHGGSWLNIGSTVLENNPQSPQERLQQIRFADWNGSDQSLQYAILLRRRLRWKNESSDGLYQTGDSRSLMH